MGKIVLGEQYYCYWPLQYYYWGTFGCLGNAIDIAFQIIIVARAKNAFKTIILCFQSMTIKINLLTSKRLAKGRAISAVAHMNSEGTSVSELDSIF